MTQHHTTHDATPQGSWRGWLGRLTAAAAAATLAASLGATAASASTAASERPAMPPTFSPSIGPIAQVKSNASPALTTFTFPGSSVQHELILWKGFQANLSLYDKYTTNAALTTWSAAQQVGSAPTTLHRPSAAFYVSGSVHQIIVVWQGSGPAYDIWYSIGIAEPSHVIDWGPEQSIPGTATSNGPSVFKALHSNRLILVWKDLTTNDIGYMIGTPIAGGVHWGTASTLPGDALTSASPSVAEVNSPTGANSGTIYVFWSGTPLGRPFYETTADPLTGSPTFSPEHGFPLGKQTRQLAGPEEQAVGANDTYPLLVAYVNRTSDAVNYVLMNAAGATSAVLTVPGTTSILGPALFGRMLAATAQSGHAFYNLLP